ncbi:GNAT family N-acetyltransferase [Serratia entomophila]|uniref:GNAT family N-acetyltransferase n=1 Tax=Serratia entomophila TaxID=42906 RepID=UPI00217C7021|nr:GNAT family N-acetyltransferase [Serratia entomophila]CAI0790455.1 ribosomal-protein-alanine acetyltransferase [Serratia entomophila]CAI1571264.1 ribosomal-protein-alanine acetyltransferase [Serratia entomophila]CAI1580420.1 ribosomal-protein-alanine acetyltransferase [Serratia entomophila]CAI1604263.1 ribosomal-protein-alanine acetyltransferase [Serratia entomophila]CAI1694828.1 ribosomal-protein-alanine acetyltransferase [Serratia entomophila]
MLIIESVEAVSPQAQALMAELSARLAEITGDSGAASFDAASIDADGGCFLLVRNAAGEAIACGALRRLTVGVAELKRMYVCEAGNGIGGHLLRALEQRARLLGYRQLWLETRRVNRRAVGFYLAQGYRVRENYGRYQGNAQAICFEKTL